MNPGERSLFKTIYKKVWEHVFNYSKVQELAEFFPLPGVLYSYKPQLSPAVFFMLSKVYFLTCGGAKSIDSRLIYFKAYERQLMQKLTALEFIERGAFDPLRPSQRCVQHVFISITFKGLTYYNDIVKRCNIEAMKVSRDQLE